MESPTKRPRLNKPWESDDDDDLSFQPQEASDRRDPGYQLSVQRAVADNRFMSTMAHIFEKYGRDFEGVGDEIDMMTGEIVVNNGHLKNMRDESDVGMGPRHDTHDTDEEDEGVRLEDLLEEERWEISGRDDDDQDDSAEDTDLGEEEEEEEDRMMHGKDEDATPTTLLPRQSAGPSESAQHSNGFASKPFASMNPYDPASMPFDYPHMSFGVSPLSFGHSPLAFNPLAQHLAQPGMWDTPEIPQHQVAANRLALQPRQEHRSRSPTSRKASIWSGGSLYEPRRRAPPPFTRRIQPRPGVMMKPRPKKLPQISHASARPSPASGHQSEDDEDAIMTGKSSRTQQLQMPREIQDSDEESLPSPKPREPLRESVNQGNDKSPDGVATTKGNRQRKEQRHSLKRKIDAADGPDPEPEPAVITIRSRTSWSAKLVVNGGLEVQDAAGGRLDVDADARADAANRRRSARERKQVESFAQLMFPVGGQGKTRKRWISSDEAAEQREQGILENDPAIIDRAHALEIPPMQKPAMTSETTSQERVVPDSQDSLTPPASSVEVGTEPQETYPDTASIDVGDVDSGCILSDDEMPLQVPRSSAAPEAFPYASSLFRPIQGEDTDEPIPKSKSRSHEKDLEATGRGGSVADEQTQDAMSNVQSQKPKSPRSQSRRRKRRILDRQRPGEYAEQDSAYDAAEYIPPPSVRTLEAHSADDDNEMSRRRSTRFTQSEPTAPDSADAAEALLSKGLRGRKHAFEVRWLMKYNGHESEDEASRKDAPEEVTASEGAPGPADAVKAEVAAFTPTESIPVHALSEKANLEGSMQQSPVQETINGARLDSVNMSTTEGDVQHLRLSDGAADALPVVENTVEVNASEIEVDRTMLADKTTLTGSGTSEEGNHAASDSRSHEEVADGATRIDTTEREAVDGHYFPVGTAAGTEEVSEGNAASAAFEDATKVHVEKAIEQRPNDVEAQVDSTAQEDNTMQPSTNTPPNDTTQLDGMTQPNVTSSAPAEVQLLPEHSSPVLEETDQGEDHSSSAPLRLGSPELGSSVDPYELPPSPLPHPRLSPTKSSPVKPSPLRRARTANEVSPMPTRTSASPTKHISPSKITKPSTPRTPRSRTTSPRKKRTPSSRNSLLSLSKAHTGKQDDEDDIDELGAAFTDSTAKGSSRRTSVSRRIWKATPRTTEVYLHSPARRAGTREVGDARDGSPTEVMRTPGGTVRTCGVNGFRCERDFCFTCL